MNTIEVKDPPHSGFTKSTIDLGYTQTKKLTLFLKQIESALNISTSTPNLSAKIKPGMDTSFSKSQNVAVQMDNDSGYISQYPESTSESLLEGAFGDRHMLFPDVKAFYLSEDALLEKPDVTSHMGDTLTDQDASNSNGEIPASVSTESEHFSVLRDNDCELSDKSNASVVIPKIDAIVVHKQESSEEICDISDDSNVENNINLCNTFNNSNMNYSKHCGGLKDLSGTNDYHINKSFNSSASSTSANISGPLSPELFSDDEAAENKRVEVCNRSFTVEERFAHKEDKILIRNVQRTLSGVLPPPSLTTIHLTAAEILERIEKNKDLFVSLNGTQEACSDTKDVKESRGRKGSLLVSSTDPESLKKDWPYMDERYHGLHYNRSKLSETFELLCMRYAERYVSCETQSTCTVFQEPVMSSPLKRKANRLRWAVKSPGRRLSHLAKRRIAFSSANLQATAGTSGINPHMRQIAVDSKRFQLLSRKRSPLKRSPRKTPRKSPRKKLRTPSSSAKKRLSQQLQYISSQGSLSALTASRLSATKRALFQSPEKLPRPVIPSTSGTSGMSPFKKRTTPKCALFTSPSKSSALRIDNKRKRLDSDDGHPPKLFRSASLQESVTDHFSVRRDIQKVKSATHLSTYVGELSAHHKKKLQWAVYEALRSQNVGINHSQFKEFASVLARVTRRFLPNLAANVPRPEGGTSDKMLRIAKQHVYAVIKGKSVDEIIQEYEIGRLKNSKPIGYVGLETAHTDTSTAKTKETVFKDRLNTMSKETQKLSRDELIKTTLTRSDNRADRARRMINFDGENGSHVR